MTDGFAALGPGFLNGASFGAYAVDQGQTIRFWNAGAERILGYAAQDVIGRACYLALQAAPDESLPPVCLRGCPFIRLAEQGIIPSPVRTQLLCASGQRKKVMLAAMLVPVDDGQLTLIHVFRELVDNPWEERTAETPTARVNPGSLTGRELQTLRLMAAGLTNREIADSLTLSYHTVRNHVCNIRGKLQARNREEAVRIAGNLGLI